MKRYVLSSLFFLAMLCASAGEFETHYGIGVVSVKPYNYFSIAFWKNPSDKIPFDEMYFQRDSGSPHLHCGFSTTGIDSLPFWFAPEHFLLEENKMHFTMRCIRKDENWCQVVVNNNSGETKWVQLGTDIEFRSWEKFYSSMASIEIVSGKPLLYASASERSKNTPVKTKEEAGNSQLIRAIRIEGNWMFVELTERTADGKEISRRTGWIKWRDDKKPLIAYTVPGS